jgi:hypothetical protein
MLNAVRQSLRDVRRLGRCIWAVGLGAAVMIIFVAFGALAASNRSEARTQATKRLAADPQGLPWDGCTDVEGFVGDAGGRYSVQSARCDSSIQVWLLKRAKGGPGNVDRPQVVDQLAIRALQPGEIFSAGPYCLAYGRELRWLAIYNWKSRKRITGRSGGIVEAWTANLQTGRFERAPRALIKDAVCTANPDE